MPEEQGLTSLLCDYAANLQYEDLPAEVIATAKRLGAGLAGGGLGRFYHGRRLSRDASGGAGIRRRA